MSIAFVSNPAISNMIQDRTLEREFHDVLFPQLLFRGEAMPELWNANIGERMVMTRGGLMTPSGTPLVPGADPTPKSYLTEQWEIECSQYGDSLDTHMPTSHVALAPTMLLDARTLGLNAGQSMDLLARNKLFVAYQGGNTNASVAALISATALNVASINGFTQKLLNGRILPVSASNPISVTFPGGTAVANTVIAATPNDPSRPNGPGVLTLGAALSAAVALRAPVKAGTASFIQRVGGGTSVDALTSGSILTLADIQRAVAILRGANVPPKADGLYHVHLSPAAEYQLMQDNAMQRIYQSIPDSIYHREAVITVQSGCLFLRNNQAPAPTNSGTLVASGTTTGIGAFNSNQIGADVINGNGVNIDRAIVIGGGALYEKYVDEGAFMTDAGVTGKIGEFTIVNQSIQVMTERIRYILRAPLDRLQQVIGQTWSWSGDFGVPTDALGVTLQGAPAYRRAVVIEHAGS